MYDLIAHLRECAKLDPSNNTYAEAADAIEELIEKLNHADDQIERLVNAAEDRRWIPVTERLSEQEKQVLVTGIEAIYGVKQLDGDVWRPTSAPSCYWGHWMPLPEPPKEGET